MGALMWKKFKELATNKKKIIVLFILNIIITVILAIYPIDIRNIMFGLFLFNSLLTWLELFSIEDFVFAEAVLGTKISIKNMWLGNIIMINLLSFLVSIVQIIIVLGTTDKLQQIGYGNIVDSIIAFVIGLGLTAFATFYISDYSKIRNILSSIGGIANIIILGYIITVMGNINKLYHYRYYVLIISNALFIFSVTLVYKYTNPEKFILNIKKLGQAYDNASVLEE